ncbi:IgGFc-binding protein-like isoform X1 [Ranitomeya variabilis]|uniref:IgGFc-binding protein-like isoform X1 n=2 Tax=Ranitomeya variabilis TaxID=490064 RepID=UPI004055F3D2
MDLKLLLCAWVFLCLGGIATFPSPGTDFALVIMQNVGGGKPRLELLLTSFFPDTKANIRLPRRSYSTVASLTTGIPTPFELPRETELLGSARSNMTIRVISNKPISVVAINMMPYSTGVAAVSPISDLGNEYYIMTPEATLEVDHSQVAIVNGPKANLVSVLLKGWVQLDDATYLPGEKLNLTLAPWESVQLQTNESLTGSLLVSQEPVAVFAGLACVGLPGLCNHAYIQIPPTNDWGATFVLPPLSTQSIGKLTIMSARNALVNLLQGNDTTELTVSPGMMQSFDIDPTIPLVIQSQEKIMVFVNFGKTNKSGVLLKLPPLEKACVAYAIISLKDYNNDVLLVVHVNAQEGLELDHKPILGLQWEDINATRLVYANLPLSGEGYHFILDAGHDFGLVTIGTGKLGSYVLPGICLNKEYLLCGFECKNDICNAPGDTAACLSLEPPTCMAWGSMQLLTFFGTHMTGSGFCPQMLIYSEGDDLSLLPFSMERQPGSDLMVLIRVFGQLLKISAKQPGVVYVNDEKLYTPISLYNGNLTIGRFGLLATTVNVSFGLRVIIGDNGFLHLQIARRYYTSVSGGCITQSSKEMLTSAGSRLPTQLICEPLTEVHLQGCDDTMAAGSNCQMLESEIFQSCHLSLDPKPFIVSCQGEVCTGGSPCASIELYALACGINGFHLTGWRNISNCDLQCPINSHYESCPSSCQASCSETQVFDCDTSLCYDACLCDEGYELSGGSCVPKEECGCYWQGSYYPKEESFGNNCSRKCHCLGSNMTCYLTEGCNAGYKCEQNGGLWSCEPWHSMTCTLYSDSHYIAFDGQAYNFKGFCDSTMVGVCSNDTNLTAFEVHIVQKPIGATIEDVRVTVYGKIITFSPNYKGKVNVDGTLVHTPYIIGTSLQIYRRNLDVFILQTDFGLAVSFDWMKRLLIMVPHSYMGSLCGICASEVNSMSNKASCEQTCQGICANCSSELYLNATTTCGLMTDPLGTFRLCNQKVDPQAYFEACINDLCSGLTHCSAFYAYAAACWEASAEVDPWAYSMDCGYECPQNSTYTRSQHCVSNCQSTCEIGLPLTCALQCQEGCQCDPGYMLNGDRCVLHEDCGCYSDGWYWKRGDIFYDDQCQKQCACLAHGIECKDHNCTSEEQCANIMGVLACYSRSSTCSMSGQSYHTFDGLTYPVNKNCLYVMAIVMGTERVNFEVHLRRKVSELASVQEVILKVYGYTIVLNLHSEGIQVNSNLTSLPIDLNNQIFGYENGTNIVLETDFGLTLTFNPSSVSLTIPLSYTGLVRGLCGNANSLADDDHDNLPIDKFVSSWHSYADNSACDETSNTPSDILEFDAKKYCELIPEVEGPFRGCHVVIDPQGFYNNCMSTANGDLDSVCESIEYYNKACQGAGVTVHQWESETICEPEMPPVDKPSTSAPSMPQTTTEMRCLHNMVPTTCQSLGKSTCLFQSSGGKTSLGGDVDTPIKCSLSVAKVCHDAELDYFSVSVHYEIMGDQRTDSLHIEVYGLNIVLPWNWENGVWVNNMPVGPSTCLIPGRLQISHEGHELILTALNGLVIKYSHKGLVHIYIPSGYQNYICGQCAEKDSHETSVKFTSDVSRNYSDNQCLIGVTKEPWAIAKDDFTSYCSLLLEKNGPFGKCHRILNPDRFYDLCQFHMCQELQRGGNGDTAACHDLGEYVMLCQLHRVVIKPWRNESFCPFKCPSPATYELCTKTCIQCQNGKCTNHCLEGCNCGDGYYWNGVNCVGSVCPKDTSPAEPENLNCDNDLSLESCHICRLNDQQISTFGNISSPLEGNGVYDILRKCDSSAPQWLRVTLRLEPPNPVKLFIFYERNFITINSAVEVWVNGQLQDLPVSLETELSVSKSANVVVLSLPGSMALSFSPEGKLEIEVTESLSTELCGACAFGNLFPSHSPLFSLESWRAEDLSW